MFSKECNAPMIEKWNVFEGVISPDESEGANSPDESEGVISPDESEGVSYPDEKVKGCNVLMKVKSYVFEGV